MVGAASALLLARVYGRTTAGATALSGAAALVVWLFVATAHLSVPLNAEADIGILEGLTPTGIVALLAFPLVAIAGLGVIGIAAPRAAVASAASVVHGLRRAGVAAARHWYLAPVLLGGAAAGAATQDAEDAATVLAVLTGAWALLGAAAVAVVPRLCGGWLADEVVPEGQEDKVAGEEGARRVVR